MQPIVIKIILLTILFFGSIVLIIFFIRRSNLKDDWGNIGDWSRTLRGILIFFLFIFVFSIVVTLLFQGGTWLYENIVWFKKVDAGDIYENQLTQKRFMITEARRGWYIMDSLQQILNYTPEREPNDSKAELKKEMKNINRGDTYFRCNNYLEFFDKYNKFGWLNADIINSKLYKKIN
jgi:hypothetical protein